MRSPCTASEATPPPSSTSRPARSTPSSGASPRPESGARSTTRRGPTRSRPATPSRGHRPLAHLADVSVSVELGRQLSLNAYYGHAFGQGVVRTTFAGADTDYGFVELLLSL